MTVDGTKWRQRENYAYERRFGGIRRPGQSIFAARHAGQPNRLRRLSECACFTSRQHVLRELPDFFEREALEHVINILQKVPRRPVPSNIP